MLSVEQLLNQKPRAIHSIGPEEPVLAAIKKMAEHHIGALLVMSGEKLVGIMSERDYARKVILHGKSSHDIAVRDIMTGKVVTVHPGQTVEDCMALMTARRVRHLPPRPRRLKPTPRPISKTPHTIPAAVPPA